MDGICKVLFTNWVAAGLIFLLDASMIIDILIQVASLSRQFAVLHNALKFDVMHMLTTFLSSQNAVCF